MGIAYIYANTEKTAAISFSLNPNTKQAMVHDLNVPLHLRQKGIGSKLLKQLEDLCTQHGITTIYGIFAPGDGINSEQLADFYVSNGYTMHTHFMPEFRLAAKVVYKRLDGYTPAPES